MLSFLYHIGNSFALYLFALAANANVSILEVMLITPLVGILVMIPVSVNGLGIQESSYVFYLERVGVAGVAALLTAVLARLALFVFSLIGGLLFLLQSSASPRRHSGARLDGCPGDLPDGRPRPSVLDRNLKEHESPDFFVGGSETRVTPGGVPPALTLTVPTHRPVEHLMNKPENE